MPYITQDRKTLLENNEILPENAGDLNYLFSRLVDQFLTTKGGVRYSHLNEAMGALECSKLELYRRIAAPYEDQKIIENGDVYINIL